MNDLNVSILLFFIASLLTGLSQLVKEKYDSNGWSYFILVIAMMLFAASSSLTEVMKNIGEFATILSVFMFFFYMVSIMYFVHKLFRKSPITHPD